jgi:hypothetical protein
LTVTLTSEESQEAINGGMARFRRVKAEGLSYQAGQRKGRAGHHESDHICGAVAEYAFYKMKGRNWTPTLDSVDHGDFDNTEIKATYRESGNLIIPQTYAKNKDFLFVLAIVSRDNRSVEFVGVIHGHEAITDRYWNDRMQRPCWFIPRRHLRKLDALVQPELF